MATITYYAVVILGAAELATWATKVIVWFDEGGTKK